MAYRANQAPFLVARDEFDRRAGLEYARQIYGQFVNSPRRDLKNVTPWEGGFAHVSADNMSYGESYVAAHHNGIGAQEELHQAVCRLDSYAALKAGMTCSA